MKPTDEERRAMEKIVEELLLENARMTLDMRATVAAGTSPNRALEMIRSSKGYNALAVRNAEKVLEMIVEELKQ